MVVGWVGRTWLQVLLGDGVAGSGERVQDLGPPLLLVVLDAVVVMAEAPRRQARNVHIVVDVGRGDDLSRHLVSNKGL